MRFSASLPDSEYAGCAKLIGATPQRSDAAFGFGVIHTHLEIRDNSTPLGSGPTLGYAEDLIGVAPKGGRVLITIHISDDNHIPSVPLTLNLPRVSCLVATAC